MMVNQYCLNATAIVARRSASENVWLAHEVPVKYSSSPLGFYRAGSDTHFTASGLACASRYTAKTPQKVSETGLCASGWVCGWALPFVFESRRRVAHFFGRLFHFSVLRDGHAVSLLL